ncbi:hypothetical protein [Mycobacterium colombiense]
MVVGRIALVVGNVTFPSGRGSFFFRPAQVAFRILGLVCRVHLVRIGRSQVQFARLFVKLHGASVRR